MPDAGLRSELRQTNEGCLLILEGELDLATRAQFRVLLDQAIQCATGGELRVDLTAVPFVEIATLSILDRTAAQLQAGGGQLSLCGMDDFQRHVLVLVYLAGRSGAR